MGDAHLMPPPDVGQLMPNGFQVSSPIMRITAAATTTSDKANKIQLRLPAAGSISILCSSRLSTHSLYLHMSPSI